MYKNLLATLCLSLSLQAPAWAAGASYTTEETLIGDLLDHPPAREIMAKHLPDVVNSEQIDMARGMTLRSIQQYSPDVVTDEALAKIDAELAKLPATP